MKLVAYTDTDGFNHLSWLREQDAPDQAATLGIPHDPPALDSLGLEEGQAKTLHNLLIERELIIWRNATDFKARLVEAGMQAGLDGEQAGRLVKLYTHGPPRPPDLPFDLSLAIEALPIESRARECIKQTFAQAGIKTLAGVENAPTKVGHICGMDIYQLIALLTGKV
jgi:hypothetical protein